MQLSLAATQPSPHHGIFKCQSFPSHSFTSSYPWLPTNTFSVPKCVCFPLTLTFCLETAQKCQDSAFFFCLRKYLFWREKTTKFKLCCITQKGNNHHPNSGFTQWESHPQLPGQVPVSAFGSVVFPSVEIPFAQERKELFFWWTCTTALKCSTKQDATCP